MPSPDDVLRLRGVAQDVTEHRTVRRIVAAVDLVVHAGETVAVVGRSGTGKSTLLNVMGLLAEPAEGEVWVCGERSDHVGSRRRDERRARDIGFVFQTMNLVAHLDAVRDLLTGVAEAGAAVVVVTHSPVVAEWADRVVTLLETGLLQEGSPA